MPITITYDPARSYLKGTASGFLTTQEVLEYEQTVQTDESIRLGFLELLDISGITDSTIDEAGLDRIAQAIRAGGKRSSRSRLAIVVGQGTAFEMARYYERIAYDIHNVIVFCSSEVAEIWLGVKRWDA